jgi:hypothetical protein
MTVLLSVAFTPARSQTNVSSAEARAIAGDVYIYGYPLVTLEMTRRVTTNTTAPVGMRAPMGQFAHAREYPPITYRDILCKGHSDYQHAGRSLHYEPLHRAGLTRCRISDAAVSLLCVSGSRPKTQVAAFAARLAIHPAVDRAAPRGGAPGLRDFVQPFLPIARGIGLIAASQLAQRP